jgi:hypothetical protein
MCTGVHFPRKKPPDYENDHICTYCQCSEFVEIPVYLQFSVNLHGVAFSYGLGEETFTCFTLIPYDEFVPVFSEVYCSCLTGGSITAKIIVIIIKSRRVKQPVTCSSIDLSCRSIVGRTDSQV